MPLFRVRTDGYFMGSFLKKGQEVELLERQAKYALLSGQMEWVYPPEPKAMKKPASPFAPKGMTAPPPKKVVDETGEFSMGRKVGGSLGGSYKK